MWEGKALQAGFRMLIGTSLHALDEKDRVVIPSKFRDDYTVDGESRCVICRGNGPYLVVHTMESWQRLKEHLANLPTTDEGALYYKMKILGEAEFYKLDRQGRVVLSQEHKKYARLDKELVLFGMDQSVYLYGKEVWEAKEREHEDHFQTYAKQWGF